MAEVQARTVLWYLVFIGFAVNYMIRINLNITIVDMVRQSSTTASAKKNVSLECIVVSDREPIVSHLSSILSNDSVSFIRNTSEFNASALTRGFNNDNDSVKSTIRGERFSLERIVLSCLDVNYEEHGFGWDEYQQGLVLGSFYWIHWVTQIPGGILAKKYGTKMVFGLSNLAGCLLCFLIPMASYWDYKALIFLRVFQGFVGGLSWPAMHHMTAQWIPPNERSKFVTAYLGSSVGIAIFYPLFGYIIALSSWEWVFHVCGIIGIFWYIGWLLFVFDTPAKHPRISNEERNFIEKSHGTSVSANEKNPTPWKEIFGSRAVWMNVVAQFGGIWGLFTLMTQAPTYFKVIHGWNIQMIGILSGLPHIMRMVFAYFFSIFGDYLLRSEKMSRTNVRKMATFMHCIVDGLFVLGLAYSGCDSLAAVAFLTLATAVHGAVSTGALASIVDISPNHAGIILGITGMIGVIPGFISPVIVGILTLGNQTVTSWKYVFMITSGILIISGILYVALCDSTLQSWNSPRQSKDREMQLLEHENNNEWKTDKEKEANEPLMDANPLIKN